MSESIQAAKDSATGSSPSSVAAADFNRDGKLDLAVTYVVGGNVSVLLGNGDGTFQGPVDYTTGLSSVGLAVGARSPVRRRSL